MDRLLSEQDVFKIIDNLKANFTCYDSVTLDEVYSHVKAISPAEPSRDMKEIEEVINCNADAETKCKMISNIVYSKPHYFKTLEQKPKIEKAIEMRDATPEERESIDKYIKSISKPTGINVFDFYEDEEKSCNNCKHHLKFMCKKWETCHDYSDWELNELDFVQPKKTIPCTIKIQSDRKQIYKKSAELRRCENLYDFVKLTQSEDAISRQAVLDYIYNDLGLGDEENGKDVERQMELESSYKYVKSLPSVKPQEKTGHWIMPVNDDGMSDIIYYQVRCSKCGFDLDPQTWHMELHQYGADKFCPNCGAKMAEIEVEE